MYVRQLFLYIFPTFLEAVEQELDTYVLTKMLESFVKCLDLVEGNVLDKEKLDKCVACIEGVLKEYVEFIASQNDQKGEEDADVDEEEEERMNDEISNYEDAIGSAADIVGRLIKYYGPSFLPCIGPIAKLVLEFIKPTSREAERHIALCIVDDIVQHGGKEATTIFPQVMPFYFNYLRDADPAIRQAAAYGLGIFGQVGQEAFAQYVPEALTRLSEACSAPDARSEDFAMATDNAISSVARICLAFGNQVNLAQVLPVWLHWLPILEDEEEALLVYTNLCHFVEHAGASILGAGWEHVPKAVSVLVGVLGTPFVDEAVTQRIAGVVRGLSQRLPQEVLQKAWSSLPPESQGKLQQILSAQ